MVHSFPTRRSSDLHSPQAPDAFARWLGTLFAANPLELPLVDSEPVSLDALIDLGLPLTDHQQLAAALGSTELRGLLGMLRRRGGTLPPAGGR